MTHEARKIARHYLGDRLHWIGRGGPHADLWIVQAWPDRGHMLHASAPTVAEAAADCASQLRATGWTPTHARLEWQGDRPNYTLVLVVGRFTAPILSISVSPDMWWLSAGGSIHRARTPTDVWSAAVAHVASLDLPCVLPAFPETPDAP